LLLNAIVSSSSGGFYSQLWLGWVSYYIRGRISQIHGQLNQSISIFKVAKVLKTTDRSTEEG